MSKELNISPFEEQLKEQFSSLEVPAPDEVWSDLDQQLDQVNSDMQFDQQVQSDLSQVNIQPPASVWQGIQSSLGMGSAGVGAALVGKWVLGVLVAGGITYGAIELSSLDEEVDHTEQTQIPTKTPSDANASSDQQKNQVLSTDVDEPIDKSKVDADSPQSSSTQNGNSGSNQNPDANRGSTSDLPNPLASGDGTDGSGVNNNNPTQNQGSTLPGSGNDDQGPEKEQTNALQPELVLMSQMSDTTICSGQVLHFPLVKGNYDKLEIRADGSLVSSFKLGQAIKFRLDAGQYNTVLRAYKGEQFVQVKRFVKVEDLPTQEVNILDKGEGLFEFKVEQTDAFEFAWFIDGRYASQREKIEHKFYDQVPTRHRISLHGINKMGCRDSVITYVQNNHTSKVGIEKIPNSFSPNGDGINDVYIIPAEGVTSWNLVILDKSGKIVFQTTDPAQFWDGTSMQDGNPCSEGLYFYQLRYSLAGEDQKTASGRINLLK